MYRLNTTSFFKTIFADTFSKCELPLILELKIIDFIYFYFFPNFYFIFYFIFLFLYLELRTNMTSYMIVTH